MGGIESEKFTNYVSRRVYLYDSAAFAHTSVFYRAFFCVYPQNDIIWRAFVGRIHCGMSSWNLFLVFNRNASNWKYSVFFFFVFFFKEQSNFNEKYTKIIRLKTLNYFVFSSNFSTKTNEKNVGPIKGGKWRPRWQKPFKIWMVLGIREYEKRLFNMQISF